MHLNLKGLLWVPMAALLVGMPMTVAAAPGKAQPAVAVVSAGEDAAQVLLVKDRGRKGHWDRDRDWNRGSRWRWDRDDRRRWLRYNRDWNRYNDRRNYEPYRYYYGYPNNYGRYYSYPYNYYRYDPYYYRGYPYYYNNGGVFGGVLQFLFR